MKLFQYLCTVLWLVYVGYLNTVYVLADGFQWYIIPGCILMALFGWAVIRLIFYDRPIGK